MRHLLTRREFNLATLLPLLAEACAGNAPPSPPSQVLVTGGNSPLSNVAQRDICVFDSGCGHFVRPAAIMAVPRTQHTATPIRLSNGRDAVLLAGGTDFANNVWSSWEIVFPDGSAFTTGNLATPRLAHTATMLGDGRVLLCGGITSITEHGNTTTATATNTAEIFNPATLMSTPTDAAGGTTMTAFRVGHTATLIDNGPNGSLAGWVLIAGGTNASPSAELFNPATNSFSSTVALHGTEMQVPRSVHQAIWLPGINQVLITGGADRNNRVLSSAEIYNPGGGFIRIRDMNLPRTNHTAINIGLNVVLIAGGLTARQQDTASAELWNPTSQSFTVASHAMTRRRANHRAALLTAGPHAGDVLLVGGVPTFADADIFHPADQSFTSVPAPIGNFGPYNNAAVAVTPPASVQC